MFVVIGSSIGDVSCAAGSIGSELCDRVLGALFDIWLLACARSFPPPPLWKAFSEVVLQWRHHEALVIQWRRVVVSLTVKTLALLFGDDYVAGSSICKSLK